MGRTPLPELDHRLRAEGYRPGAPDAEVAAADAGTAAQIACRRCGRLGLGYLPYLHPERRFGAAPAYRALAVCTGCGAAEEF